MMVFACFSYPLAVLPVKSVMVIYLALVSPISGYLVITYQDIRNAYDELPKPKDENGEIPSISGYELNTTKKVYQIAHEIFTREEIRKMDESEGSIMFIALSSGKIVSTSFVFHKRDTGICLHKMVNFSHQVKEHITITTAFNREIFEEGYVLVFLSWLNLLKSSAE